MLVKIEVLEGSVKIVSDKSGHEYLHAGGGAKEFKTRYIALADDGLVQSGDVQPADTALGAEDLAARDQLGIPPRSDNLRDGEVEPDAAERARLAAEDEVNSRR